MALFLAKPDHERLRKRKKKKKILIRSYSTWARAFQKK